MIEALVLGAIVRDHHPPPASEISRELGFSRQSVQRAVIELVTLDLVRPRPDARHKIAPIFSLSKPVSLVWRWSRLGEQTDLLAAIGGKGECIESDCDQASAIMARNILTAESYATSRANNSPR